MVGSTGLKMDDHRKLIKQKLKRAKAMKLVIEDIAEEDYYQTPADVAEANSRGLWHKTPHLEFIASKVAEACHKPIRLIITLPPRYGKSELISHWTPVWFLDKHPDKRIILASYEATFAASWGRKGRNSIEENETNLSIRISKDRSATSDWEIEGHGGGMVTAGVGGPITGKGADLLIIDDPIKNIAEAMSPLYRENTWDWWRSTARTRLEPGASVIIIQTRWHWDDLVGRLLADKSENWEIINLPAIAERDDPLGREEGEVLWEERFNADALAVTREAVGPKFWLALYQQRPSREEGSIFHLDWWKYHTTLPRLDFILQIWDTAFKAKKTSDWSACVTLGRHDTGICVLDVWRGKVEFPELVEVVKAQNSIHHPHKIMVEDAASGTPLQQSLTRDTNLPIVGVSPKGGKETRAEQVTGVIEAGRVSFPEEAEWLSVVLSELTDFPNGVNDDVVDALVYGINELSFAPQDMPDQDERIQRELAFGGLRNKNF